MDSKNITVLVDHDSWILPYAEKLVGQLQNLGHATSYCAVTAFRMVNEIDAVPVYAKRPLSLAGSPEEIYRGGPVL